MRETIPKTDVVRTEAVQITIPTAFLFQALRRMGVHIPDRAWANYDRQDGGVLTVGWSETPENMTLIP